jgi:putative ABC transport system substrate-binding protein
MLILAAVLLASSAWPSEGRAQTRVPRVGIITVGAATDDAMAGYRFDLIRRAFAAQGWSDGRTIAFELRNARGDASRFAEIAAELVRLKVDLIWADSAPALRATYAATRTVPIVAMDFTTDPVGAGYAQSYGRPGGNMTGVFLDAPEFSGKWLELLKAMVPGLSRVAVLWDPSPGDAHLRGLQAVAPSFGVQLQVLEVRKPEEIDAIASAFPGRPQALIVLPSPMTLAESPRLARLAAKQRLPATSIFRLFAEEGGAVPMAPKRLRSRAWCSPGDEDPPRRQTWRPADRAADQVRAGGQSQGRQGAQPHDPGVRPGPSGRSFVVVFGMSLMRIRAV